MSIWNCPKSTNQKGKYLKNNKIKEYIIDETAIKTGSSKLIWLWLIIEPTNKEILATDISRSGIYLMPNDFYSMF